MGVPRVLPVALVAFFALGCSRGRDCSKLAELTNQRSAEIAQIQARESDTPQTLATDMSALEAAALRIATEVESVELGDEALTHLASTYRSCARELADAAGSYATRMEALARWRDAQRRAQTAFDDSGRALLDACATASPGCNDVAEVLRAQPEAPEPNELPTVLDAYADSLDALELEDDALSDVVDSRIRTTRAYADALTERAQLRVDIEDARDRIDDAVDRQNSVVDQLNRACEG